jgi:hypothetical protein
MIASMPIDFTGGKMSETLDPITRHQIDSAAQEADGRAFPAASSEN